MTAVLRISKDLALPLDAVTQAIAILARRGAGKTYTGSVLVEEVVRAKVPLVVLDPTGAWWGLRTSAGGDRPGLPVIIFGGDHGDVPLDRADGTAIADVVLDHPGAYVADLSAFTSKAAEQAFAADFLERLYRGKKGETGPLLVVVDEADVFAPQQPRDKGDQLRTRDALEASWRETGLSRGRSLLERVAQGVPAAEGLPRAYEVLGIVAERRHEQLLNGDGEMTSEPTSHHADVIPGADSSTDDPQVDDVTIGGGPGPVVVRDREASVFAEIVRGGSVMAAAKALDLSDARVRQYVKRAKDEGRLPADVAALIRSRS